MGVRAGVGAGVEGEGVAVGSRLGGDAAGGTDGGVVVDGDGDGGRASSVVRAAVGEYNRVASGGGIIVGTGEGPGVGGAAAWPIGAVVIGAGSEAVSSVVSKAWQPASTTANNKQHLETTGIRRRIARAEVVFHDWPLVLAWVPYIASLEKLIYVAPTAGVIWFGVHKLVI